MEGSFYLGDKLRFIVPKERERDEKNWALENKYQIIQGSINLVFFLFFHSLDFHSA